MTEYIDREEYCKKHCRCSNEYCDRQSCPIWKAPAADVAPVVHGRWITYAGKDTCSRCRAPALEADAHLRFYYCPNCGAKMDGGADNGDKESV